MRDTRYHTPCENIVDFKRVKSYHTAVVCCVLYITKHSSSTRGVSYLLFVVILYQITVTRGNAMPVPLSVTGKRVVSWVTREHTAV